MPQIFFITGTDTGVGKTVLTALLIRFLRERGVNAAALKPVCSGGRNDAKKIYSAMNGALSMTEINPWHFRVSVAPLLAARKEKQKIKLSQIVSFVRQMEKRFDVLLVEGAGGLLSPLGENFNSRDLILKLKAKPIVVSQNKLGTLNHILLTLEALPRHLRRKTKIVLMSPKKADASNKTNPMLLAEFVDRKNIFTMARIGKEFADDEKNRGIRTTLSALAEI